MGLIDNFLVIIRSNRYGEQIRGAIADGLELVSGKTETAVNGYNDAKTSADQALVKANTATTAASTAATNANTQADRAKEVADEVLPRVTTLETEMPTKVSQTYYKASNSTTAAGTAAKKAECEGFKRFIGVTVKVVFTVQNTHASPTLNVGDTGAAPIYSISGVRIGGANLLANTEYELVWDGTNWLAKTDPTVIAMFKSAF